MALRINQNVAAYNAHRNLSLTDTGLSKSLERLSSGLRINRAADDAAGLHISEKLRGQVSGLNQATRNAQDGISMIQTAEGALNEAHVILQRVRELAVQASNGTLQDADREAIQAEVTQLSGEISRISSTTAYNSQVLLDGSMASEVSNQLGATGDTGFAIVNDGAKAATDYAISYSTGATTGAADDVLTVSRDGISQAVTGSVLDATTAFSQFKVDIVVGSGSVSDGATGTFDVSTGSVSLHVGANQDETLLVAFSDMSNSGLGIDAISVATATGAEAAITTIDAAIGVVATQRGDLGAIQNRLEHTISNLGVAAENLSASESRIRDVDMAAEMVSFTRNQIMVQAGTAMLAQANAVPQTVLQLLA